MLDCIKPFYTYYSKIDEYRQENPNELITTVSYCQRFDFLQASLDASWFLINNVARVIFYGIGILGTLNTKPEFKAYFYENAKKRLSMQGPFLFP